MVPEVGATAFAITSLPGRTTCGVPAETADRKKRFTPSTASALMYSGMPVWPARTTNPATATIAARISAP